MLDESGKSVILTVGELFHEWIAILRSQLYTRYYYVR